MQIDGRAAYAALLPLRPVMDAPPLPADPFLDDPLEEDMLPAVSTPARPPLPSLQGCFLLIVDDEEESRDALDALLGDFGARIALAGSVRETLDFLDSRPHDAWPDTLLCDIMLDEDGDGYDVLREIREREIALGVPRDARMQAISMTGFADAEHHDRALTAGFKASLTKPAPLDRLIAEIKRPTPPSPYLPESDAG